jgi:hypothetical protein
MNIFKPVIWVFSVFACLFVLSCCVIEIGDLKKDPGKYGGQVVQVSAAVNEKSAIPLIGIGIYRISDPSGNILLVSTRDYAVNQAISPSGLFIAFDGKKSGEGFRRFSGDLKKSLVENKLATEDNQLLIDTVSNAVADFMVRMKVSFLIFEEE